MKYEKSFPWKECKKLQHEKGATWKECSMERVWHDSETWTYNTRIMNYSGQMDNRPSVYGSYNCFNTKALKFISLWKPRKTERYLERYTHRRDTLGHRVNIQQYITAKF